MCILLYFSVSLNPLFDNGPVSISASGLQVQRIHCSSREEYIQLFIARLWAPTSSDQMTITLSKAALPLLFPCSTKTSVKHRHHSNTEITSYIKHLEIFDLDPGFNLILAEHPDPIYDSLFRIWGCRSREIFHVTRYKESPGTFYHNQYLPIFGKISIFNHSFIRLKFSHYR